MVQWLVVLLVMVLALLSMLMVLVRLGLDVVQPVWGVVTCATDRFGIGRVRRGRQIGLTLSHPYPS